MLILLENLKLKKYKIQVFIFFILFLFIFFILDYLNMSYSEMLNSYGLYLVIINILLNVVMATLNSLLLFSSDLIVKGSKSSSIGFFAVLFGMFTYGCTTCLIAFFANFGIILSVMVLPFAGLPYKIISLFLIILGLYITTRKLKTGCKVDLNKIQ